MESQQYTQLMKQKKEELNLFHSCYGDVLKRDNMLQRQMDTLHLLLREWTLDNHISKHPQDASIWEGTYDQMLRNFMIEIHLRARADGIEGLIN